MAIETFNFSDTGAEHFAEIKTWLETNATDYFDSFELSEDKLTLTCKIGEKTALTFARTSERKSYCETFYNFDGTRSAQGANTNITYIDKIVKTSSGIAIRKSRGTTLTNNYTFITKTNKGDTAFVFLDSASSTWDVKSNISNVFHFSAFTAEKTSFDVGGNLATATRQGVCRVADTTVLSPICLNESNGAYMPNCMVTVFGNVLNTECTLDHNGEKYFYNGYIALKE